MHRPRRGLAAGTINTVVGSGTLITFPVLLAFGYAPVTANVSNTIGLVPGSVSGAIGYRRELVRSARAGDTTGDDVRARRYHRGRCCCWCCRRPRSKPVVPVFIAIALVLTVLQPRLNVWLVKREIDLDGGAGRGALLVAIAVYVVGVYGGYFGAAQGILLLGILGVALSARGAAADERVEERARGSDQWSRRVCTSCSPPMWSGRPRCASPSSSILGAQLGARYGRQAATRGHCER